MSTLAKIAKPVLPATASEALPGSQCARKANRRAYRAPIGFLTGNNRLLEMDGLAPESRFSWFAPKKEVCHA